MELHPSFKVRTFDLTKKLLSIYFRIFKVSILNVSYFLRTFFKLTVFFFFAGEKKRSDLFILPENYLSSDSAFDFVIFLRMKSVLVKATVELLSNLEDQSKYLVELDLDNANEITTTTTAAANDGESKAKKIVKIIMEPID